MASIISRPMTPDSFAGWTETPVGSGFDRVDEVVTQPTAPSDTSSDKVDASGTFQYQTHTLQDVSLGVGENIIGYKIWIYGSTTGTLTVRGYLGPRADMLVIPAGSSAGWYSATEMVSLTQAAYNGYTGGFMSGMTGSGTATVYASYIEVLTDAPAPGAGGIKLPLMQVG